MVNLKVIMQTGLYIFSAVAGAIVGELVEGKIPIPGANIGIGVLGAIGSRLSAKIPLPVTMFFIGWTASPLASKVKGMTGL